MASIYSTNPRAPRRTKKAAESSPHHLKESRLLEANRTDETSMKQVTLTCRQADVNPRQAARRPRLLKHRRQTVIDCPTLTSSNIKEPTALASHFQNVTMLKGTHHSKMGFVFFVPPLKKTSSFNWENF